MVPIAHGEWQLIEGEISESEGPMSGTLGPEFSLRSVGASTLLLTGATVVAQGLSLGRELFIASQVGLSPGFDALLIALVLPTMASGLLVSGPSAALVPAYLDLRHNRGREDARRLAGAVLTWAAIAGVGFTGLMLVFAGPMISVIGPGLSGASRSAARDFLPLLAPLVVVSVLSGLLTAISQAEQRFAGIAASTFAGSLVSLVITVNLWDPLHLGAVAVGLVGGGVATLVTLVVSAAFAGTLPPLTFRLPAGEAGPLRRHALPLMASSALLQMSIVADRAVASLIAPGAISALRYADVLVRIPISAVGPAWSQSLYPSLVRAARDDSPGSLGAAVATSIRYVIAAFVPISFGMAALAPWCVELAFGRGAFTQEDVELTSAVVGGFAPLILILMVLPAVTGAHNARRRSGLLLATGGLSALCNLVLNIILGSLIGVPGIALSTSLTTGLMLVFLARRLADKESGVAIGRLWGALARACGAALVAGAPLAAIAWSGFGFDASPLALATLLAAIALMLSTYVLLAHRLGFREPAAIAGFAWRALRGRRAGFGGRS